MGLMKRRPRYRLILAMTALGLCACNRESSIIDLTARVEVSRSGEDGTTWRRLPAQDDGLLQEQAEPRIRTFRLQLPPHAPPEPVLRLPLVHQGLEVYQDGRLIYSFGAMSGTAPIPWRSHIVPLQPWSEQSEIRLRVFSRIRPIGVTNVSLGSKSETILLVVHRDLPKVILCGVYIVVGLVSILAFFRTGRQTVFLSFGVFTILFSAYAVSNRTNEIQHLLLDSPLLWMYLEFACLYTLAPAGLWFFSAILPGVSRVARPVMFLNLLFAGGCWVLHLFAGLDIVATLLPGLLLALLTSAFGLFQLARGALAGDRTSRIVLFALGSFSVCAVFDSLVFGVAFTFGKFLRWNIQTTPFGFLILSGALSYIVGNRYVEERKKAELMLIENQARLIRSYQRFVPEQLFRLLDRESVVHVRLGDASQRDMSILFSDLRSFTTISEKMSPAENLAFLNDLMGITGPVIRNHRGFIDKFIGDAIMALFPGEADDAVDSAIAMKRAIADFNAARAALGRATVSMGIGLNSGRVVLGTLGEEERMDGTVISDAVNLASRVEGLTKYYGVALLITQHTLIRLSDPTRYRYRLVDRVMVKGKTEAVSVFEVFDGDSESDIAIKTRTQADFERGVQEHHATNFPAAIDYFQQVINANPQDQVAAIYLRRSEYFAEHGVPIDWEGISIMEGK